MEMENKKNIYSSHEVYEMMLAERKKHPPVIFLSGIPALDEYIDFFEGGELVVISGRTGHGKTTFGITLTRTLWEKGLNCLWFSYEMGTLRFLEKTKVNNKIPLFYLPLHLVPNRLEFIEHCIQEAKEKYDISAVFIDHLHYLCDTTNISIVREIGRVMRWLKITAVKYNIVIFCIAHVQKLAEVKVSEIDNDHLKDGSAIAQEADNVFFILRPDDTNKGLLKITKNRRNGWRGKIINLIKKENCFEGV